MIEKLYQNFKECSVVATDTRNLPQDCMFFALKGANFNGNKFAKQAIEAGAKYAVVDEEEYATAPNILLVDDVLKALQDLANHHRRQFDIPFIGITGSNGKTTTKELIRDVLLKKYKVLATKGNFNNHIGVPLTLLGLNETHEIAIIEMGANHVGEIADLSAIAEPNVGLITNIGKAHIEGFGSVEGIKKGKGELYDFLRRNKGKIFINEGDDVLKGMLGDYENTFSYGNGGTDLHAWLNKSIPTLDLSWERGDETYRAFMSLYGDYNFHNAAVAIAIGYYYDVPTDSIKAALEEYESDNNRSQLIKQGGVQIYLDAYNANPSSMKGAIESFIASEGDQKMVILGDMLELGDTSIDEHTAILSMLQKSFNGIVVVVGAEFAKVELPKGYHRFKDVDDLISWLHEEKLEVKNVLVKGSRGVQLEKTVDALT